MCSLFSSLSSCSNSIVESFPSSLKLPILAIGHTKSDGAITLITSTHVPELFPAFLFRITIIVHFVISTCSLAWGWYTRTKLNLILFLSKTCVACSRWTDFHYLLWFEVRRRSSKWCYGKWIVTHSLCWCCWSLHPLPILWNNRLTQRDTCTPLRQARTPFQPPSCKRTNIMMEVIILEGFLWKFWCCWHSWHVKVMCRASSFNVDK